MTAIAADKRRNSARRIKFDEFGNAIGTFISAKVVSNEERWGRLVNSIVKT